MNLFKEVERLYHLGFAILLLKPKSKVPVKFKWTSGPRESLEELKKAFKPQNNIGVRLGSASKIGENFLAVIDIDVKSTDEKHSAEAYKAAEELFPGIWNKPVWVKSGRGNGSCHVYVVSKLPAKTRHLTASTELVKVYMPSVKPSRASLSQLSEEDINEGYRMRPAWEISLLGEGSQAVLPPSIHPDSKKPYEWAGEVKGVSYIPLVDLEVTNIRTDKPVLSDFESTVVDFVSSGLSDEIVDLILNADCDDRSVGVFKVCLAMLKVGFNDNQILSVLTDQSNELGKVAYEHAKTHSRKRAAQWLLSYPLKAARKEYEDNTAFDSIEDADLELLQKTDSKTWQETLERHKNLSIKDTINNVVLILRNELSKDTICRDLVSVRDFYQYDTPWGSKPGEMVTDDEIIKIRVWIANRFKFEPSKANTCDAVTMIAIENAIDPLKTWLESLEWDFEPRLDTWLKENFEAEGDDVYLAEVFRKWIVAMVIRAYEPGAKFDWVPIFEGAQGVGKSSFGRILATEKYFTDWLPDLANKDSALALQGIWCAELSELASLRRNEIEIVKGFVTRKVDKIRPPYGRLMMESPRRCVFFGTTNREVYLKDDSGNRRFKPLKVGYLNFEKLKEDRDQLFAEAVFLYKHGFETVETLELSKEAKAYEKEIHKDKMIEDDSDVMKDAIEEALKKGQESGFNFTKFRMFQLFEQGVGPLQKWTENGQSRFFASKALKSLGAKNYKSNGKKYWKMEEQYPEYPDLK